ncbi:hypothetical protein HN858_03345 [Candidatus Falkowbacteria bacterium]|nr:hypothetical protein [Candidatus Falkowbacteria bacterium]MBT5502679.1 hypothetical protein [Candidatus Falkowbacteria bacterium]MBT6574169.1 hypothetical protein [Candidatus Falkowbacteria bacterium]MBT7348684.1 hypothetical protein [Candidatus Falkowbacteria bacterium]MBT7500474.1 hypothetical protein [Candidatus Falkowbacteria bacterium]
MRNLWLLFVVLFVCSCGENNRKSITEHNQKVVVSQKEEDAADGRKDCNKVLQDSFRVIRAKQTILYKNDGDQKVKLDIANKPTEDSTTLIGYEILPFTGGKYILPFFRGELLGTLYFRINDGKWYEICAEEDSVQ